MESISPISVCFQLALLPSTQFSYRFTLQQTCSSAEALRDIIALLYELTTNTSCLKFKLLLHNISPRCPVIEHQKQGHLVFHADIVTYFVPVRTYLQEHECSLIICTHLLQIRVEMWLLFAVVNL